MTQKRPSDQTLRQQILQHLETLNIPLATEQLDEILTTAAKSKLSYLQLLERFLAAPAHLRRERSIERRLRAARFRDAATFESFDWDFNRKTIDQVPFEELATGDFIQRRDNVVFVGESGLGKSHLIQSIGRIPRHRTTLYGSPAEERVAASYQAQPLTPVRNPHARNWGQRRVS